MFEPDKVAAVLKFFETEPTLSLDMDINEKVGNLNVRNGNIKTLMFNLALSKFEASTLLDWIDEFFLMDEFPLETDHVFKLDKNIWGMFHSGYLAAVAHIEWAQNDFFLERYFKEKK